MDLTNLNFSVIGTANTVTTNAGSALTVTFIFCVCAENITLPALLHCVSWTLELQALHIKILYLLHCRYHHLAVLRFVYILSILDARLMKSNLHGQMLQLFIYCLHLSNLSHLCSEA